MFKRLLNEVCVDLVIEPAPPSPLLVKAPRQREDQGPATFLTTKTGASHTPYIPGGSIKGVIAAEMTQIVSRWHPEWSLVSDPFKNACADWVDSHRDDNPPLTGADIYRIAGPVERCMGMTSLKGRWVIDDAMFIDDPRKARVIRPGIAIDRDTGANRAGLTFTSEAIGKGRFTTTLMMQNYELWQLGLLAHVLARLDRGMVQLGYGKNRGFGRVHVEVTSLRFQWYGWRPSDAGRQVIDLPALSALAASAEIDDAYGWRDGDLQLSLPLDPDDDVAIGYGAKIDLRAQASLADRWGESPWPEMGRLVAEVLPNWAPDAELLQRAVALRERSSQREDAA